MFLDVLQYQRRLASTLRSLKADQPVIPVDALVKIPTKREVSLLDQPIRSLQQRLDIRLLHFHINVPEY